MLLVNTLIIVYLNLCRICERINYNNNYNYLIMNNNNYNYLINNNNNK